MLSKISTICGALALVLVTGAWPQHGQPGVRPGEGGGTGPGLTPRFLQEVARYEFNDPSDLGADSGPNGYDLTPVNAPTATGGAPAYAADFEDSTTEYALGSDTASSLAAKSVAWVAWVRPETRTAGGIAWFAKGTGSNEGEFEAYIQSNGVATCRIQDNVGTKIDVVFTVLDGQRRFMACRYSVSDDDIEAALDNSWSGSPAAVASDIIDTAAKVTVGGRSDGTISWDGAIGVAALYVADTGDALTDAITTSLYNSGKGKTCSELTTAEQVNLVSCWDMDEDGGPYVDSIGSNNLTGVNTPTQAAALVEQPSSGMSTHLVAASAQELKTSNAGLKFSGDVSACAWVNPVSLAAALATCGNWGANKGFYLRLQTTGQLRFYVGAAELAAVGNVSANSWHHICGTVGGTTQTAFVDSVAGTPNTMGATPPASTTDFSVGANVLNFDGAIDSVLIFDKDIGQQGVSDLYNSGVGVFYAFDWTWEQPFTRFAFAMPEIVKTPRSPEEIRSIR